MFPHFFSDIYRSLFFLLLAFLLFFLPYLSFDFGIACDEILHQVHGKHLLHYMQGKSDMAIRPPFNDKGELAPLTSSTPFDSPNWSRMNNSGGTFDLLCNWIYEKFPALGEYETRHLIGSVFGFLAILFSGLLAKELGGWRAGFFSALFLAASPRFIAHSMNNPKDLPFATMYVFTLYQILLFLKDSGEIKLKRILFIAFGISLATSIRISGMLLIIYLVLFTFANAFSMMFEKIIDKEEIKKASKTIFVALIIAFAGYTGMHLFWPYLGTVSFFYPLLVLKKLSNFNEFDSFNLFDGRWIHNWEIPWNYIPQWIWITIPLFISFGLLFIPVMFISRFRKIHPVEIKYFLMLLVAAVFPVIYIIVNKSNVYDEYRHLLFVFPPLAVICALSWDTLLRGTMPSGWKWILVAGLIAFVTEPLWWMKKNHPQECAYFSPLIGGTDGAFKKYETDYWGSSLRAAAEWIAENKRPLNENDTVKVMEWYIRGISVSYYLDKFKHVKFVQEPVNSDRWDYWVYLASAAKHNQNWLWNWPPPGTIHEIKADNTPLCAIIVNQKKRPAEYALSLKNKTERNPTFENYFQLGFACYNSRMYKEAIEANKKAIELNPEHEFSYNNMAASYMALEQWDEVISACEKALDINPAFNLARNNLNYALSKKNPGYKAVDYDTDEIKIKAAKLVNQGLEHYNNREYEKCIEISRKALELKPASAVAYNNICICHYLLGNYSEAEKACKKALKIKPDFDLAKNNMKMIQEKIKN